MIRWQKKVHTIEFGDIDLPETYTNVQQLIWSICDVKLTKEPDTCPVYLKNSANEVRCSFQRGTPKY